MTVVRPPLSEQKAYLPLLDVLLPFLLAVAVLVLRYLPDPLDRRDQPQIPTLDDKLLAMVTVASLLLPNLAETRSDLDSPTPSGVHSTPHLFVEP